MYNDIDDDIKYTVKLNDYYISRYEITQAVWKSVMGSNPSKNIGDNLPVENVNWDDCQLFIKKLNRTTRKNFRLPTEAEWEYAARCGKESKNYTYSGSNNIDDVCWYIGNSYEQSHEVGTKAPNELGLYDMNGNVWEWCSNWFGVLSDVSSNNPKGPTSGSNKVVKGGGHSTDDYYTRNLSRYGYPIKHKTHSIGFRIVIDKKALGSL